MKPGDVLVSGLPVALAASVVTSPIGRGYFDR